jgi:hypothetical protein
MCATKTIADAERQAKPVSEIATDETTSAADTYPTHPELGRAN